MVNSKGGSKSNTYLERLTEISNQFNFMFNKYFSKPANSTNSRYDANYSKKVRGFLNALTNWSKLIDEYQKNKETINVKQKISSSEKEIITQYLLTVKNMKEIIEKLAENDKSGCKQKLELSEAKIESYKQALALIKASPARRT